MPLCEVCQTEEFGCACDAAVAEGCWLCDPGHHARPPCPPDCLRTRQKVRAAVASGKVGMSPSAVASVPSGPPNDQEKARTERYREIVLSAKLKPEGHSQKPSPSLDAVNRLYTVTTIASSPRYGGTRTVVVCLSFERAKQIVERNEGDIFECSYQLAVIEATAADRLYFPLDEQYWYVWEGDSADKGSYRPIERPEAYEGITNFGIG